MSNVGAIVVAAGTGTRMGTSESKQYLQLAGKPILIHTLERFQAMDVVGSVVLVVGADDVARCEAYAEQYGLTKVHAVTSGGSERQASVYRGLQALPALVEWVAVHDGVRPFIGEARVRACLEEAKLSGAAVLAVPVKDTIKVADANGVIRSTPDRRSLWAIQTPQAFRLDLLREAHEQAVRDGFVGTDDAMLVERLGVEVRIAEGAYTNIKITTPEDLLWAETIAARYGGEGLA
ncbi:2-C-methyl-D-erythritol 4-phosphate cytidylyltransferase [Paenibacillus koleovorans]|uniref:2-C-methyl-D-erythritol 4-phosphate cytidylyltransferase n=1 Tax=Paenibacillus koleovorans TaxID=121608 RepID=UPI000FD831F6|nr:2-C-methyl-D-erythritol 4-phosphate cytidylyltransferase [Paenibacillus koleovorans]